MGHLLNKACLKGTSLECKVLDWHIYYAEGNAFSLPKAGKEDTKVAMTFCV